MLLRNSIDVGHPSLALLTMQQLATLHGYGERAESAIRGLLRRLMEALQTGKATIPEYELTVPDADVVRTIEKIRANSEPENG
jgi:hypothetical protein